MSSPERAYVPIGELPPEEQGRVEGRETKTDEIWKLRSQLATFYRQYRQFLPEIDDPAARRGKRRMRIDEVAAARANFARLEDLLPLEAIAGAADIRTPQGKSPALARRWRQMQVTNAVARAIAVYRQLEEAGGVFRAGSAKPDADEAEANAVQAHYRMRWGELGHVVEQLEDLRARASELEELRDAARSDPEFVAHPDDLRAVDRDLEAVQRDAETLTLESPEAYLHVYGGQLQEIKEIFDARGRIVETPYVRGKIERIGELLADGRPTFIHGELGSGKTEIAKHLARTRLSAPHLARWERENPPPERTDAEAYARWDARRGEESEALVISGHKGIEIEQILAARAIERGEAPSPEEQVRAIAARWEEFRKTIPEGADASDLQGIFERAYLEAYRSPVETKTILAPLLRAMRAGRPVIIDEMNAIPHHVLIVLNDLLARQPGDMVTPPFPGEEPFRVAEGFSVMATGNYKPEDGAMYVGRQQIDAAFLSRWGIVSYDYLPMRRELEPSGLTPGQPGLTPEQQREHRRGNELYQMLVTRLLNPDLTVEFPAGDPDELQQLEQLAVVARNIQDIFSGRQANTAYYANVGGASVPPQDVLKENVLSIRHLLPILDRWKADGFVRPLDDYLFLEYIARSDARPQEKLYLYRILKVQGDFFPDTAGWPGLSAADDARVLQYPIEEKMFTVDPITKTRKPVASSARALQTYSRKEVVERLFGPAPKRTKVPQEYLEGGAGAPPETAAVEDVEAKLARARLTAEITEQVGRLETEGFGLNT